MRRLAALALLTLAAAATAQTPASEDLDALPVRRVQSVVYNGHMAMGLAPRNVVLMIADGFGPASATLARAAAGRPLALDAILVGSAETSATDSRVTDSAAGATAYACGIKTYNGAIAVDTAGAPCRTILEAAEARGMATGLVTTTRLTHATPASFAAHVGSRAEEAAIAQQMVGSGVDLLLGGGARYFDGSDGADLYRDAGLHVIRSLAEFRALDRLDRDGDPAPYVGLFAADHLDYEIDRGDDQPSLAEMATRALDLLATSADGGANGFFLMIEGGRIDHAGHGNDAPAHVRDILAYDAAVAAVLAWAAADGQTLVVSTADHETGGLTLGRDGVYAWDPAPLLAATMSSERFAERLEDVGWSGRESLLAEALGADSLSAEDHTLFERSIMFLPPDPPSGNRMWSTALRRFVDHRAGLAWTTTGHTAVDVNLYAFGPGAERFHGAMGNDAVGRALFAALGLTP